MTDTLPVWALFLIRQAWAAIFGAALLAGIVLSKLVWQADWPVARYDALVIYAVSLQILMLATRLETLREMAVIAVFHAIGTAMEVFKLSVGSWDYPEQGLLEIGGVPLFTGFMYASVGSYIARSFRLFEVRLSPYPPLWITAVLAVAIYGNFIFQHFWIDIRVALFAATFLMFWPTMAHYRIRREGRIPLILMTFFGALLIWVAENIGTVTDTWRYPGQGQFDWVSLGKLGSWYLLIYVSLVLVTLIQRDALGQEAAESAT